MPIVTRSWQVDANRLALTRHQAGGGAAVDALAGFVMVDDDSASIVAHSLSLNGAVDPWRYDRRLESWRRQHDLRTLRVAAEVQPLALPGVDVVIVANERVREFTTGKTIRKVVAVEKKLVNVVAT